MFKTNKQGIYMDRYYEELYSFLPFQEGCVKNVKAMITCFAQNLDDTGYKIKMQNKNIPLPSIEKE